MQIFGWYLIALYGIYQGYRNLDIGINEYSTRHAIYTVVDAIVAAMAICVIARLLFEN